LSVLVVFGFAVLVIDRILPGAPGVLLGQAMVRMGMPGALTINGTPVATSALLSTTVVYPTIAPQPQTVIQRVEVPVIQTVLVPAPTFPPPTPLPAGVSLNVNGSGAQLSVSNGETVTPAPPAPPSPGQPGFVQSFQEPPTLGPGNPFIGCLGGRNCSPNAPTPWPQPGEPGFVESFREP
jgi:hypothetical protein